MSQVVPEYVPLRVGTGWVGVGALLESSPQAASRIRREALASFTVVFMFVLAPAAAGLIQLNVRVNVSGEGPRASGKVIRWHRMQLGELGIELQGGHRLATFQIDTQVLTGADRVADDIAAFAQVLFAAVDGRPMPVARTRASPAAGSSRGSAREAPKAPASVKGRPGGKRAVTPARTVR